MATISQRLQELEQSRKQSFESRREWEESIENFISRISEIINEEKRAGVDTHPLSVAEYSQGHITVHL